MNIDKLETEYADSDYPLIRFFDVEKRISFEEERLNYGAWVIASRKTVP